jgi:anti-sigma regulatory factor (Ser/Thr protein kinase)
MDSPASSSEPACSARCTVSARPRRRKGARASRIGDIGMQGAWTAYASVFVLGPHGRPGAHYPAEVAHKVASRPVPEGETWARSALARLGQLPGVHRAGLALAEGGGRRLLFTASDRDNGRSIEWCEVDAYEDVPLNHTVLTGEAVVGSLDDLAHRYRAFTDRQVSETDALASIPILAAGHIQGAYALFFNAPQRFDHAQLTRLEDLGARLGADLRCLQRATTHASRSLEAEPVPRGARAATYSVAADPRAIAGARHFVLRTLGAWGVDGDAIDNAILCLSELVTNALLHSDGGCELRVVLDDGVLTTTVRDGGSTVVVDPSNVTVDPLAVHGRGLQLVDAFSTRWGSELDAVGMTVWFVLEQASSPIGRSVPALPSMQ